MPSPRNKTLRLTAADRAKPLPRLTDPRTTTKNKIFLGDVIPALKQLEGANFPLAIADPPYNNGVDFGNRSDRQTEAAYRAWVAEWVALLPSVLREDASIYICTDWVHSGFYQDVLESAGFHILNRITWKREKGRGAKHNWKQNMEDIWFAVRDPKHYTFNIERVKLRKRVIAPYRENGKPKDWYETPDGERERLTHPSNIWTDLTVPFWSMPENTEHPTQKPEALVERIIEASSDPGDRVLDLFSGSGTTSVVAKRLGRMFTGIEMNPDYVRIAMKRLKRERHD